MEGTGSSATPVKVMLAVVSVITNRWFWVGAWGLPSTCSGRAAPVPLPTKMERFTLLVSPHGDKDARDQYEIRTHKRIIDITESSVKVESDVGVSTLELAPDIEKKPRSLGLSNGKPVQKRLENKS